MCRWLADSGSPILLKEALYTPAHSLVDQSLHSRLGAETTNGDGFGVGWYGDGPTPASITASSRPGTSATCTSSPPTSARRGSSRTSARRSGAPCSSRTAIPSATGAGCSCTTGTSTSSRRSSANSCSRSIRRSIPKIEGHDRLRGAVLPRADLRPRRRPAGRDRAGDRAGRGGRQRLGVRSPSRARSPPPTARASGPSGTRARAVALALLHDGRAHAAQALPRAELLERVSDEARLIVSEPLGDVAGVWNEVPEASYGIVGQGRRRAAAVPAAGAVEVDPRGCLTGRAGDHRGAAAHLTVSVPCIPAARCASTEQ